MKYFVEYRLKHDCTWRNWYTRSNLASAMIELRDDVIAHGRRHEFRLVQEPDNIAPDEFGTILLQDGKRGPGC